MTSSHEEGLTLRDDLRAKRADYFAIYSIEWTTSGTLCAPPVAAHVER